MLQPVPYLAFDGTCAEAMRFYAGVLGGKLGLMSNGESPFAAHCAPDQLDRIVHARLELADGGFLYGGDCPQGMPYPGIHGVSLTLSYDDVAEARTVFDALAEGGKVTMPMGEMFWAKAFGMLVDRFGCSWIVNGGPVAIDLKP